MSLIHWMPENNTHIDDIDSQHRKLATHMNELEVALDTSSNKPRALNILNQIMTLSTSHFAREEDMMNTHAFPDLDFHQNEHFFFEDLVYEIEDAVNDDKITLAQEKLGLLSDWFIDHIRKTDQEYLPYLNSGRPDVHQKLGTKQYRGQLTSSKKTEPKKQHIVTYRGQIIEQDSPSVTKKASKKTRLYRGQKITDD